MPREFRVRSHSVGPDAPMFVIAEIGLNHNGKVDLALRLVDAAARAGVSAVKLQLFEADRLVAAESPSLAHVADASLREVFRRFELDAAACATLVARARSLGLAVIVTPFDLGAVQQCVDLGVDALKIASGDLTHVGLIEAAAATGLPVVLSTGLSTEPDVTRALDWARRAGAHDVALLHCVSAYPTPDDQQNLRAVATLASTFDVPVGLSDHGMGRDAALLACALGAVLYERHLHLPGTDAIDAAVSSSPDELADIVRAVARGRAALGEGQRRPMPAELPNLEASRRGLYATRSLAAGHVVTADDVVALRPVRTLDASRLHTLIGSRLGRRVEAGSPFDPRDLASPSAATTDEGPTP